MSITAPFTRLISAINLQLIVLMVYDLSNVFLRTGAVEFCCISCGIHDKGQCLVKHICTKFMCVPLWLRTFVQIHSLMNVGMLCFLAVRGL